MKAQIPKLALTLQHSPLTPELITHSKGLSPQEPHLTRTNSNLIPFKKTPIDKKSKQKKFEEQIKYANPDKLYASIQSSLVRSENNLATITTHRKYQETKTSNTQSRLKKISDGGERQAQKNDQTTPFDVTSALSPRNRPINRGKNEGYYLYWKRKAEEYLESNMKLMEDIQALRRENQQFKQRIQDLQIKNKSVAKIESNASQLMQTLIKKEQSKSNTYLLQKIEDMQREMKKQQIVIKAYQQKVVELNSRVLGDSQRTKLINKLKTEIDNLRVQLNISSKADTIIYTLTQESKTQERYEIYRKQYPKSGYFENR